MARTSAPLNEQHVLGRSSTVGQQVSSERLRWFTAYVTMLGASAVLAILALKISGPFSIAFAALVITVVAWIARPLAGMHLMMFFTLLGDWISIPWFPITKNFSSHESALVISDRLTFSPLFVVLVVAMISWSIRHLALHEHEVVFGPLFRPLAVFTGFIAFGLMYGIARGGDLRVAIFESNGLLYLPLVYFLASNTCHTARQYRGLLWTAMAAIVGQSFLTLRYYFTLSDTRRENLEALGEHGSAVLMNALFVLLIVSLLFKGSSVLRRLTLLTMAAPVVVVYILSQRRAAFVGLGAAFIAISFILLLRNPRRFWRLVPLASVAMIGYIGAFWNSTSQLAFPAQAIKAAIAPNSVSASDQGSDLYRHLENLNLNITIRSSPLTGLGFGHEFLQPYPLPDISFFEFYRYIPHNSILWIWIQAGFLGFVALLFLLGRSLALGARLAREAENHADLSVVLTCVLFVLMYAIYAYVDIAWYARETMFLGFCLAVCSNYPIAHSQDSQNDPTDEDRSITRRRVEALR